jgi:hypothetical protein
MAAAPLLSFAAMAQYPLFYVRDYCIAAVEVPKIVSGLSLVSMGYISLADASALAAIRLGCEIDDSRTAALVAQIAMGAKGTQFGLASDRLRLGIEFRFFL